MHNIAILIGAIIGGYILFSDFIIEFGVIGGIFAIMVCLLIIFKQSR